MPSKKTFGDRLRGGLASIFGPSFDVSNGASFWNIFGIGGTSRGTTSGQEVTAHTALRITAFAACVRIISDALSDTTPRLEKLAADGMTADVVRDHPVALLLEEPNSNAGWGMDGILKSSQVRYQLDGNDYLQIERGTGGVPTALWPLHIGTMPLIDITIGGKRGIIGYRTTIQGVQVDLDTADVIHIRHMSLDGVLGLSPIRMAANALGAALAMEQFAANYFKNEAQTGGFLMVTGKQKSGVVNDVAARLNNQRKDPDTGINEAHKIKIVEGGDKFIPDTSDPQKSQLVESREHQLSEIARITGVPLPLLQSQTGSTVWGTGIATLLINFAQNVIQPIVRQYESEMTRKLLTPAERLAGYRVRFDLSAITRLDATSLQTVNSGYVDHGIKTRNEARRDLGLPPLDGLDIPLIAVNLQDGTKAPDPADKVPPVPPGGGKPPVAADDEPPPAPKKKPKGK